MRLTFHLQAELELTEAFEFYKTQGGVTVAKLFLAEVERAAAFLLKHPKLGTATLGGRRFYPLRRFPYSLFYRANEMEIRILAVGHQHRLPNYWRARN